MPTLSEIDELLPEGIGDIEEKETLSDITDSMSTEIGVAYSEGEDELDKINAQLKAVDTTSEFFEQEKVRERERRDRDRAQDIRERVVMGDAVEEKDRRWLDRYDARMVAGTPATDNDESVAASTDVQANGEAPSGETIQADTVAFTDQLEALTEESNSPAANIENTSIEDLDSIAADEHDDGEDLDSESADDLSGNIDWNDEDEADGTSN